MVSGYDKTPPEPRYEPEVGPGGRWFVVGLLVGLVLASLVWLFV